MLITTCAHCRARFRVTPQQLNAKQGQVRCGSCQKVFNGFEALERFAAVPPLPYELPEIPSVGQAPAIPTPAALGMPQPSAAAVATPHEPAEPSRAEANASRAKPRPMPELTLEVEPPEPPSRAW